MEQFVLTPSIRTHAFASRVTLEQFAKQVRVWAFHIQFGIYSLRDTPNSEHIHFGNCHIGTSITVIFQVTMYMHFAREVGPSANSVITR